MPKTKRDESSTDSDSGPDDAPAKVPPKKAKNDSTSASASAKPSGDGSKKDSNEKQWVLEKSRQVRINEFKGRQFIDIREFYEKNGELLPGKKGISLSPLQWKKLLSLKDEINAALD